jgi:hypothetical protein
MSAAQRPRSSPQLTIRDSKIIAMPARTAQPEGYWLALISSASSLDKVMSLIENLRDGLSVVLLTSIHDYDHALDVVRAMLVGHAAIKWLHECGARAGEAADDVLPDHQLYAA